MVRHYTEFETENDVTAKMLNPRDKLDKFLSRLKLHLWELKCE